MSARRAAAATPTVPSAASGFAGRRSRRSVVALLTAIVAGGLLAAIVANQSAVHWRENVADSDLFAYHGWCVTQGARPYLDIWDNKPPGIWWVNAGALTLCGPTPVADVLLGATALLLAIGGVLAAAARAYDRSVLPLAALATGILLTQVGYECGANRTETFVMAAESVAVAGYLSWLRTGRLRWLALAGAAAGLAPWFKQSGVAALVAGAAHLAVLQLRAGDREPSACGTGPQARPWLVALGAFAAVQAMALAALARDGALGAAYFAIVRFNQAYFAVGDATWTDLGHVVRGYTALHKLWPAGLLAASAVLCLLLRRRRRPGDGAASAAWLALAWLLVSVYLTCAGPGRLAYHLMPALPPLALLCAYPLHLLAGSRGLAAGVIGRPALALLIVLWVATLLRVGRDSVAAAVPCWQAKPHWTALQRRVPAPSELQGAAVAALTAPHERIYVFGWSPGTYRYARRLAASRFATFEKLSHVGEHARFVHDEALATLRALPPPVLVMSVVEYAAVTSDPQSALGRWLVAGYHDCDVIQGMHILVRRDRAAEPRTASACPAWGAHLP